MASPARKTNPERRRPVSVVRCKSLIKLIHVGKRDLGLDDATYRAMLEGLTGKSSSRDLEAWELDRVIDHMVSRGFQVRAGRNGTPARKLADDPQSKLIRHLWLKLSDMGEVRNPSEDALNSFVRRQTGRDRLEWISTSQASRVIESLKAWVERAGGMV